MRATREGAVLLVEFDVPAAVQWLDVCLRSDRNSAITRLSETSPFQPRDSPPVRPASADRELWFPAVDIALEAGMRGELAFAVTADSPARGRWMVNGMYREPASPVPVPADGRTIVAASKLLHWENSVYVEGDGEHGSPLASFSLWWRVPVAGGTTWRHTFRLLSEDWQGSVSVSEASDAHGNESGGSALLAPLATVDVGVRGTHQPVDPHDPSAFPPAQRARASSTVDVAAALDRGRLLISVEATTGYLLRSRDLNPHSPTHGSLHLFYDLDARLFRSPHWMWGAGPGVRVMLEAPRVPELSYRLDMEALRDAARGVADCSYRFRVTDPLDPGHGGVLNRFNIAMQSPGASGGYTAHVSPADAGFTAGWAWVPLYEATRDRRYLDLAKGVADQMERLVHEYELVPQEWLPWEKRWTDHTIDEAGFGVEGLAELYRVTRDTRYQRIGERYMEQCLATFGREDGLWERRWDRSTRSTTPTGYMTRGLGWAMEGLLATHRLMAEVSDPDGQRATSYLNLATKMADHLIHWQHPAGCWSFQFNQPVEHVGISAKGTALWSVLLYRLYGHTRDSKHLRAAQRALAWCIEHQYLGPDPDAVGGLMGCSPQSAVHYRRWFRISCAYGAGFFGIAALAELNRVR